MRSAFIETLSTEVENDPSIMLLTGDLGYGVLDNFERDFPQRFLNCGVAEQAMVSVAAGLAASSRKVFVYSIVNFATFRCLEQIRNDVAFHGYDVCIVSVGAGTSYGTLGYSHHGLEDIAVMRSLPGMSVYTPSTQREVSDSVREILATGGPNYLRLGRVGIREDAQAQVGVKGLTQRSTSGSVLLLSCGATFDEVASAHAELSRRGLDVEWWTVRRMSPLDGSMLTDLAAGRPIVTVEDHSVMGGLGTTVLEALSEAGSHSRVVRLGFPAQSAAETGSSAYGMLRAGLGSADIMKSVLDVVDGAPANR